MTRRHRRKKSLIAYGAAGAVLLSVAAYGTIALATPPSGDRADGKPGGSAASLQADFASAAKEFKVPQSVLMAVSYQQTLWESHGGQPSTTGNYNVMGLTQVTASDVEQPTKGDQLAHVDLSGDPAVSRHFDAAKALKSDPAKVDTTDPKLHTLDAAAKLIDRPAAALRTDPAQSVRGAAALLAAYEKAATGSLPADPGKWYAGVARFSQAPQTGGDNVFAQRVFSSIRSGESRLTGDGQLVTLAADPAVKPSVPAAKSLAAATTAAAPTADCPSALHCNFIPAAYKQVTSVPDDFGNYNVSNRPANGEDIRYLVVHDMEGTFEGTISTFQNHPEKYVSAHYLVAGNGRVTQMVQTKDEAWHAGNKTVNMHSIGVEHEGYAIDSAQWYTEQEYASSAALVKYLAGKFGIPLDRQHILGHDEVPGPLDANVGGQHWDPGPYWDWNHYMSLLGAPTGAGGAGGPVKAGQEVTITPPFTTANAPTVTYYPPGGAPMQTYHRPVNFVWLRTSASSTAPLLSDKYIRASGSGTNQGPDWGDKAVAGARYVVAGVSGDWTAIWYGGQKAWFSNPGGQWTAPVTGQKVITPVGTAAIPVYGRAYPEDAAYHPPTVPVQDQNSASLTKYTVPAGQSYVQAGPEAAGDYWFAGTYAGTAAGDRTLVKGTGHFTPIEYNHRIAWVRTSEVKQISTTAPDPGSTRYDLLGRDTSGVLWQYQGTGSAASPYYTRYKVGAGWQGYNAVTPLTALRADAVGDMVARDTSGVLWYYRGSGNPAAPFLARLKVGAGWGVYNALSGVRDVTGDGKPDLVARDSAGKLWLYAGTGTPGTPFAVRVQIGTGWQIYQALIGVGDLTGDGKADLLAREPSGVLWLYKGTGSATAPFAARVQTGTGWQIYNSVVGPGDLTGDGRPDLFARDTTGKLWLYKGTGSATAPYAARAQVGTGWQIYDMIL